MAFAQIAETIITRTREDGAVKTFTFTLEQEGAAAATNDLPIVGEVILKHGATNDSVEKAIKPVQLRLTLKGTAALVKDITTGAYREYKLTLTEASEGTLFVGYLKEGFEEFSVYKQAQTVDLVFTSQVSALEDEAALDITRTFYQFFKGIDDFTGLTRGIDFYSQLQDTRQTTEDLPNSFRFSPDVLLGDRDGSYFEAFATLLKHLNWQVYELGDRVAIADAYERITNPTAVQKWTDDGAGNYTSSAVNLQISLDDGDIIQWPKGKGRGTVGRVVYQWIQYNRDTRSIGDFLGTTVNFGESLTRTLDGLLLDGDTFRLGTGTGTLRRNVPAGGAPAESGEASVFELKITNLLNGNEYWWAAKPAGSPSGLQGAGSWVSSRDTIKTDYSFGINGGEANYTLYPTSYDVAEDLPETGGYWAVEFSQIYEATGISNPTTHEADAQVFGEQVSGQPPILYKKFDASLATGQTRIVDIYLDSDSDYATGQAFEVLVSGSWVPLEDVFDDGGNGELGLVSARRKLKLLGAATPSYFIRIREAKGLSPLSIVQLDVEGTIIRCLPVAIERFILAGYVEAEIRVTPGVSGITEQTLFDAERETASEGVAKKTEPRYLSGSSSSSTTSEATTWGNVSDKPFIGIGKNLEVDSEGNLETVDEPEFDGVFHDVDGSVDWKTFADIKEVGVPSFYFIKRLTGSIAIVEMVGQEHDIIAEDGETTLTLMREGSNGAEFLDIYNNGYADSQEFGMQIQSRGTNAALRRFQFQFFDGTTRTTPFIMNPPATATAVYRDGYQLRVEGTGGFFTEGLGVAGGGFEVYTYFYSGGNATFDANLQANSTSRLVGNVAIGANSAAGVPLDVFDLARMQQRLSLGDFNSPQPVPAAFGGDRLGDKAFQLWGGMDLTDSIQFQLAPLTPSWAIFQGGTIPLLIFKNFNSPFAVADIKGLGTDPADTTKNSEATLALFRGTTDEQDSEFMDLFNNGYYNSGIALDPSLYMGIRIQKRGTGIYRPFKFQHSDGTELLTQWETTTENTTFFQDVILANSNNLFVGGGLFAKEFVVNQTRVFYDHAMSQGGGKIGRVLDDTLGDEIVEFEDENGDPILPVVVDDILHIQERTGVSSGPIVSNIWRRVAGINNNAVLLRVTNITWTTAQDVGTIAVGDNAIQKGNTTDVNRQSYAEFNISGLDIPQQKVWRGVDDVTGSGGGNEVVRVWGLDGFPGVTGTRGIAGAVGGLLAFELSETRGLIAGFEFTETALIAQGTARITNTAESFTLDSDGLTFQAPTTQTQSDTSIVWIIDEPTDYKAEIGAFSTSGRADLKYSADLHLWEETGGGQFFRTEKTGTGELQFLFGQLDTIRFVTGLLPNSHTGNQGEVFLNLVTSPTGDYYEIRITSI